MKDHSIENMVASLYQFESCQAAKQSTWKKVSINSGGSSNAGMEWTLEWPKKSASAFNNLIAARM